MPKIERDATVRRLAGCRGDEGGFWRVIGRRGPSILHLIVIVACSFGAGCATSHRTARAHLSSDQAAGGIQLGDEYTDYAKTSSGGGSTHSRGFGWRSAALYLPNRVLDLIDIVHVDIGVGPAFGFVGRVTKWGQFGYREFTPASLRLGLRGRRFPAFIERTSEFGAGPGFFQSRERTVTPAEVGAGLDVFLVGAYVGVSFDQLFDFAAGIVGQDPSDDDLR